MTPEMRAAVDRLVKAAVPVAVRLRGASPDLSTHAGPGHLGNSRGACYACRTLDMRVELENALAAVRREMAKEGE